MNWKKTLISSIVGAILWTVCLTPYVWFVTRMTIEQYISWLGMQFILVPLIAPVVFWGTEKVNKKFAV